MIKYLNLITYLFTGIASLAEQSHEEFAPGDYDEDKPVESKGAKEPYIVTISRGGRDIIAYKGLDAVIAREVYDSWAIQGVAVRAHKGKVQLSYSPMKLE